MSQQKQAPLPRQEFQEWLENAAVPVLVLQKGKHLGSVVKAVSYTHLTLPTILRV